MKVLYIEDVQKLYRDTLAHNCYLLHIILSQNLEFPTLSLSELAQLLEKENQCQ